MLIQTSRYIIRDFMREDEEAFLRYQRDPRYRGLYDIAETDYQSARTLFDLFMSWQTLEPRQNFQGGIFRRDSGDLWGCAGLRKEGLAAGSAILGIEIAPDYWGHYRLAIEVALSLVDYGFDVLDLDKILGDTSSGNTRIEKLARLFGADLIAQRQGPEWMEARGWAEVDWAISRDRWSQSKPQLGRFIA